MKSVAWIGLTAVMMIGKVIDSYHLLYGLCQAWMCIVLNTFNAYTLIDIYNSCVQLVKILILFILCSFNDTLF